MPWKPKTFGQSTSHKRESMRAYDRARGTARLRIYLSAWWRGSDGRGGKRVEIARRDGWRCRACGVDVGMRDGDFVADHIVERPPGAPIDTNGYDADSNLQTLCQRCHNAKTGRYGARRR